MKDLKDRLHSMRGNPLSYEAEQLAEILGDLLDRLDTEPQCDHSVAAYLRTGKTVCCVCGKDITLQFPPE